MNSSKPEDTDDYTEARQAALESLERSNRCLPDVISAWIADAQVHATLALAAAIHSKGGGSDF